VKRNSDVVDFFWTQKRITRQRETKCRENEKDITQHCCGCHPKQKRALFHIGSQAELASRIFAQCYWLACSTEVFLLCIAVELDISVWYVLYSVHELDASNH
jgi:hypothetical protein